MTDTIAERVVALDHLIHEAEAAVYTGARVDRHVVSEFTNDTDEIMATVAVEEALCYAVGQPDGRGSASLHTACTRQEAREHYDAVRAAVDVVSWRPWVELRRDWYVFYDGTVTLRDVGTGVDAANEAIVLFPMGGERGIKGELAWSIHPGAKLGDRQTSEEPAPPHRTRVDNLDLLGRLIDAFRAADVEAVARELDDDVDTAQRDYVGGGPYEVVRGKSEASRQFAALFQRFEVERVERVNNVIGDWFVFAELLWYVRVRSGTAVGRRARFATATMFPLDQTGLIRAIVGYGTDLLLD